ncbi:hypothetical protein FPOAC2_08085 [Fusarium poae]|jgi:histone H3/H4|uniref:NCT transcriptional regulatory complex subunit A n=1 Tax=Fusarium poae TaxID=36050 RepID=A0A1B8AKC3_FUSPO|nr:hypothetical protein FPOAC1_008165 [Fusarium poae]KAG8668781.1 hypothetical protein FPOAC1_008165 [Fusarium poae]OBS21012.1 hypothetical protein FPOA_07352 [Fusarium poae]
MSADDSYAPKSPDLSSFYSNGPTQEEVHHPQTDSHFRPGYEYKAESPTYTRSASFSSYVPPSPHFNNTSRISTDSTHHHLELDYQERSAQPRTSRPEYQPYPSRHSSIPEHYIYSTPDQRRLSGYSYDSLQQPQARHASLSQVYPEPTTNHNATTYDTPFPPLTAVGDLERTSTFGAAPFDHNMPPRKAAPPAAPAIDPSPVRTKFPTARIKRIMQADEEVGKVAQQTPIAVGKALELFMIQLVTKSADVAKDKGSKRVTASMLKQVVETDEQWDFLREIVSRVENEKEGSRSKAKQESSSDEEIEEPKKRTRGGRKKKAT